MKENTSGYMNVPTTGGGTARTEFEMLTGSNFDYLLEGEIPYTSIVKEKPSNSLATTLKKQGFGVQAIHNFKGLTGSNFDYLLEGEIPYTSIVKEKPSNSLATTLKKQGFGVQAIHNFKGNFYNRDKGYKNLGFDTYTSVKLTCYNIEKTGIWSTGNTQFQGEFL